MNTISGCNEDGTNDTHKNDVINHWRDDFKNLITENIYFAIPDEQDNLHEQHDISTINELMTREKATLVIISAKK